MLWLIGSGFLAAWAVLQLFRPRGWTPMLGIAGMTILVIQIAAYRKQKAVEKR